MTRPMPERSRPGPALLLAALALTAALVLPTVLARAGQTVTVAQKKRAFQPEAISIARGDRLHFVNDDPYLHQIYIDDARLALDSPEQPPGTAIDVDFPAVGTFTVRCGIHPTMQLTVDVR